MKILDSHEFIELYRGSKDLMLGFLLCEKYNDEYVFLCPKINSYADEKFFGQKRFDMKRVENALGHIPGNMRFRFYSCIRLYKKIIYFKKVESTNFFHIPAGYLFKLWRVKPDVIIESNYTTLTPRSYLNYIASKLFRIPVMWIDCGDGGRMMIFKALEKPVAKNAAKVITYSQGGKKRLIDKYNIPSERIVVCPKPIDINKYRFSLMEETRRKSFCIGYIGRLAENKGFGTFIKLAGHYLNKRMLKFISVGDFTSEAERTRYMPLIPDNMLLTGYVENKNIPEYMEMIDLLVIPNMTNPPAFTTVLAEALASGIPCIVGIKGYEEYVPVCRQNGCFFVRPDSMEETVDRIEDLLGKTAEEYNVLKKQARSYAEKELSWEAQLPFYRSLLNEIANKRPQALKYRN